MTDLEKRVFRYVQQAEQAIHGPMPATWITAGNYAAEMYRGLRRLVESGEVERVYINGRSHYRTVIRPDGAR